MSLSEWEQNVLWQLEARADRIPAKKFVRVDIFFKSKGVSYVRYVPASAHCTKATDVSKAFKTLFNAFREDSRIIDFDVKGVDEIPPVRSPILKDFGEAKKLVDGFAEAAFKEIRSALPSDLRDNRDKVILDGSFISIRVQVKSGGITYNLIDAGRPSEAIFLASLLYKKAVRIDKSSAVLSLERAERLKVIDVDRINEYVSVYIEPIW